MVWDKVKLGDVCRIEKGNIGILKAIKGKYPLVVMGEERRTHNEYQFDGEAVVIPLVSSSGHGDRSMKRIHFQSGKFSVGSILCAVIPKDNSTLSAEFLYRYLDLNKEQELVSRMKGMANVSLSIKSIAEVEIPLPPIKIQKEIVKSFKLLETQTNTLSSEQSYQLDILKKLRQQILQDAVQGKLLKSSPPPEGEYSRLAGREGVKTTPASFNSPPPEGEYPQGEGVKTTPASGHPSLQGGELEEYKSISNLPFLKTFRRELRNHLTPAEATLWTLLSNKKLQGRKFRRQHSIGKYILDFFCPEERLAIELDGEVHIGSEAEDLDMERDIFLLHTGIKVLRFENRMVFDLPESVLKEIGENFGWYNKLSPQPSPGSPPPEGEYSRLAGREGVKTTPAFGHPSLQGGELLREETGKELLERIRAEKQKLIAEGKLKKEKPLPPIKPEEIPFEIPENWVWCRLGEVCHDLSYGTSQKTEDFGDIPVLRMGNITMNGEILYSNLKYVKTSISDLPNLFLTVGDMVFNRTNSFELVGKCGVFDKNEKYTLASYLIRVRFPETINSKICRETQIEPDTIQQNGQANFNGTKLSRILIPLPPFSEQKCILQKLEKLLAICDELEQTIQQNQKYTKELLQVALKEALEPEENRF